MSTSSEEALNWHEFICKMPKVELHLHLEGAFTFETLFQLIQKYGGDPTIRSIDDLRGRFAYKDFGHFIEVWYWKNRFFRSGEDFEFSTYETLMGLHRQNVLYVEAFFSPWDFVGNGISMEEITESVISGCKKASNETGILWNLIFDINRECGRDAGMKRLEQMMPYRGRGVVGIGLGGDERRFPASIYQEVFEEAERRGFRRTVHAGEAAGPESIRDALTKLKAERIGHGVRAHEDPKVLSTLLTQRVPLEMCVTSNVKTGVVPSVKEHPIRAYLGQGLNVSVNSDDPTMFGSTLTEEYLLLVDELACTSAEVKKLCLNAVHSAFLDDEKKMRLQERVEEPWKSIPIAIGE